MSERRRKRYRFQFRLRSLLVAVAIVAAIASVVAEPARTANQRKAARQSNADYIFFDEGVNFDATVPPEADVSVVRRLFGDSSVPDIALPAATSKRERQRIATLFPESSIWAYRPPLQYYIYTSDHGEGRTHPFNGQLFRFPDDVSTGGLNERDGNRH
jgi:hypothetical protein